MFKNTVRDINTNLNSKLRLQFEEIHLLLDKMADIVVRTEPKKSSFILDCRLGSKVMPKNLSKAIKKKEVSVVTGQNKVFNSESDYSQHDKSLGKRGSFHSVSTALPTPLSTKRIKLC